VFSSLPSFHFQLVVGDIGVLPSPQLLVVDDKFSVLGGKVMLVENISDK
jgi:hypothetical protein